MRLGFSYIPRMYRFLVFFSEPLLFEVRMRAVRFTPQKRPQVKKRMLSNGSTDQLSARRGTEDTLPPVMTTKVQVSLGY